MITAALVLLAGCGGESTARIDGLRTDPDGQGLVAACTGGSCDGPTRLVVDESPTRIDVDVVIESGSSLGPCDSAGHLRTVAARLRQPVGTRSVWSRSQQQVPFDGARLLLIPTSDLPAGLRRSHESGGSGEPVAGQDTAAVTDEWRTTYLAPDPASSSTCAPGRGRVDVALGSSAAADLAPDWTPVSRADVGTAGAQLYREGSADDPDGLAYTWTTAQGSVEISNQTSCAGDHLLSPAELLGLARVLRPA